MKVRESVSVKYASDSSRRLASGEKNRGRYRSLKKYICSKCRSPVIIERFSALVFFSSEERNSQKAISRSAITLDYIFIFCRAMIISVLILLFLRFII